MKRMVDFTANNSIWVHVALLGGFAICLYLLLNMIVCCCVSKKFENYLASELFTISELVEGVDKDQVDSSSMTMKRSSTPSSFHNEIFGKDDDILNRGAYGMCSNFCRMLTCCCSSKRRIDLAFEKARKQTAEELNITSLIKAQRQSTAICQIMKP